MSMHLKSLLLALLVLIPAAALSQSADTLRSDTRVAQPSKPTHILGSSIVSTDSLLRWQLWSGFAEWASRRSDITVYELGGYGRNASVVTGFGAPNSNRARWNGVTINSPLTLQFNPSNIPLDQSASVSNTSYGVSLWHITPLVYAVTQPRTVIQYEQSSFEYRNLDGTLAMPVTERISVQASFQGQKDNGKYSRSNYEGRRTTGNIRHTGKKGAVTDAFWLYQGAEMQESLGYQFEEPALFSFDRFRVQPRSANTASMRRFLLMGARWSPSGAEGRGRYVTVYRKLQRNDWRAADTTGIRSQEWGMIFQYEIDIADRFSLQPYLDVWSVGKKAGDVPILSDAKYGSTIGTRAALSLSRVVELHANAERTRTLSGSGGQFDIKTNVLTPWQSTLSAGFSVLRQPRPMIFDIVDRFGYQLIDIPDVSDSQVFYASMQRMAGLWRYDIQFRSTRGGNVAALSSDGSIRAIETGGSIRSSAWLERHGAKSEVSVGHQYVRWGDGDVLAGRSDEHRLQVGAFAKGYVFDRAAYIKGGAVLSSALTDFRGMAYVPQLDMWLQDASGVKVPGYHRLDLDLSMRVRSLILLARLENTLDGWTQKGYFQTLPYPMPGRRLRFGLNVHFRD